jgi:hypothetical protein
MRQCYLLALSAPASIMPPMTEQAMNADRTVATERASAAEPRRNAWPTPFRIAGEAFGVTVRISTDSEELQPRLEALLPPGWVSRSPDDLHVAPDVEVPHFTLITHDGLEYLLMRDETVLARADLNVTLHVFDAQLRAYIALHSPGHIFVHAGVVGHRGRAIVIPGRSFSGKTTLVAELVRNGLTYYSDEYAVLDETGLVHPYTKALSIRVNSHIGTHHDVESLGGIAGTEPLPLGLVVVAEYLPGATWAPRTLSPGEVVLALLSNTVPAQERPEETMLALRQAVDGSGAVALAGERGEAADMVEQVLASVPE